MLQILVTKMYSGDELTNDEIENKFIKFLFHPKKMNFGNQYSM